MWHTRHLRSSVLPKSVAGSNGGFEMALGQNITSLSFSKQRRENEGGICSYEGVHPDPATLDAHGKFCNLNSRSVEKPVWSVTHIAVNAFTVLPYRISDTQRPNRHSLTWRLFIVWWLCLRRCTICHEAQLPADRGQVGVADFSLATETHGRS